MRETGEWGEFFPMELSPFAYNETLAQEYFPLTQKEVLNSGWKWKENLNYVAEVERIIQASKIPPKIEMINDKILNWAIQCDVSKKPFKIIKQELKFYRKNKLPFPRKHSDVRNSERMKLRNPRKLWSRNCPKCNAEIQTTYAPERPEIVYCEECYLKEVY